MHLKMEFLKSGYSVMSFPIEISFFRGHEWTQSIGFSVSRYILCTGPTLQGFSYSRLGVKHEDLF